MSPSSSSSYFLSLTFFFLLLVISPSFSSPSSDDISELFDAWCQRHGKTYASEAERQRRIQIFKDNHDFVTRHNDIANATYSLSLDNAFADLTHHEFKASRLGLSASSAPLLMMMDKGQSVEKFGGKVPDSVDWRKKGAVTNVKDQGSCGTF